MAAINRDSDEFATFHTPYCVDIFPQKNKAIKVVIVIGSRGSKLNVSIEMVLEKTIRLTQ